MNFQNALVNLEQLPQLEAVDFQPLESHYLTRQLLGMSIFHALLLLGLVIFFSIQGHWTDPLMLGLGFGIWTLFTAFRFWLIRKGFGKKGYSLRERDLMYRSGLIWQSLLVIPFNRVQHCAINQGPLDRLFSLSSLKIFTAGTDTSDLSIPGLQPDQARQLKEFLLKRSAADELS